MRLAFHHTGMPLPYHPALNGLGLGASSDLQSAEQMAAAGLSTSIGILGALSAVSVAGLASGIGAAVAGAIALATALYREFQGCGQTCIVASQIADKIEPVLRANVENYLSSPVHYASLQAAFLNNFDFAWAALVKACSNPQLQDAGQRCTSDRQQGACHYHTSAGGWVNGQYTAPGPDGSGSSCWNWFVGYRDPIANDPTVVPDPVAGSGSGIPGAPGTSTIQSPGTNPGTPMGAASGVGNGIPLPLPLLVGAAVVLYFLVGTK